MHDCFSFNHFVFGFSFSKQNQVSKLNMRCKKTQLEMTSPRKKTNFEMFVFPIRVGKNN